MKVLHIAPTPFFADRGCHMRILGEIKALQELNCWVILTTYHNGRDVENFKIKRIVHIPWYNKLEAGASWHKVYLDLLLLWTSLRTCIRENPDIIHGHLHEGALIGKLVSLISSGGRIPVIFDVQGSLTGELESYGFFKNVILLKKMFLALEKIICRLPDHFVCSSYSNTRLVRSMGNIPGDKVTTLIDGIDPDFFREQPDENLKKHLGIPEHSKVVIYTGSLIKSKGIDYLLDAMPQAVAEYKSVHFLIVGYPVQQSQEKVKHLMLDNHVSFTGQLDFFQLPKYLSIADLAVDPKLGDTGEGSGKVINYMGAGLPVVCFDTTNNRSILGKGGFYARPGDSEDLAKKIIAALKNEESCATGKINRSEAVEKYSWHSNGLKLIEVYKKVKELRNYDN